MPTTQEILGRKLKILVVPANEGGCAQYRAILPMKKLAEKHGDEVELRWNHNPLGLDVSTGAWQPNWDFEDMKWADIVFTNNLCNFGGNYTARIVGKAKEFGKYVHYDTDDLLTDLYDGHRLKQVYEEKGLGNITKFIYFHSDIVSVTQHKFAERILPFINPNHVLVIIKNAIDYNLPCWNQPKLPPQRKNCVRIGWAGGIHHEQDLKNFVGIPSIVNQKVGAENVFWGFYGHPPINPETMDKEDWQIDVWKNYVNRFMFGSKTKNFQVFFALPTDQYGVMFTNIDIAIAPLEMNQFNDSKSDIKVAEAGRYKIPLIASDVGCYSDTIINGKTGFLIPTGKGEKRAWVDTLCRVIRDHNLRKNMGENLHVVTEQLFNLNDTVTDRLNLYKEVLLRDRSN